jgi:hypothetical protein
MPLSWVWIPGLVVLHERMPAMPNVSPDSAQTIRFNPRGLRTSAITRFLTGLMTVTVVGLCLYGAVDAILASVKMVRRVHPSDGFNALFDYPWWGVAHFVPGITFMTLTPLQMWEGFRNRHRRIHGWIGRCVLTAALCIAASGLSFAFTMPQRPLGAKVFMTTASTLFLFFMMRALLMVRRRRFALHRQWMIRFVGGGLAVVTQRMLVAVFALTVGIHDLARFWEFFITAAWLSLVINLSIAEAWIGYT